MDYELFEILRQWRNNKALREGKQPFMIFNNATIKATAENPPQNLDDLPQIKGWGPAKIQKYGQEVLDLLHSPQEENTQINSTTQDPSVLSVDQCISLLNKHLGELTILQVKGEINDISSRDNYAFFNLKDTSGAYTMPCFIGWHNYKKFAHLIEEGTEVIISGSPSIYKNGRLSLDIKRIELHGEGALKKAFELLKAKLEKQGYFDPKRKRALPENPCNIGLITSIHGAAIKDFKQNLKNYGFQITFEHVYVEGDYAIDSVQTAIQQMNVFAPHLDLIIVMRGGGGLENLKAFNAQEIANAIIQSRLPIITGIGHEKDISIADLCADAYFSTPTAVAMYLNEQKEKLETSFNLLSNTLLIRTERTLHEYKNLIENSAQDLIENVEYQFSRHYSRLSEIVQSLTYSLSRIFQKFNSLSQQFLSKLSISLERIFQKQQKLLFLERSLTILNPEHVLKKGFSIIKTTKNEVITSIKQLKPQQEITITMHDGQKTSIIKK